MRRTEDNPSYTYVKGLTVPCDNQKRGQIRTREDLLQSVGSCVTKARRALKNRPGEIIITIEAYAFVEEGNDANG